MDSYKVRKTYVNDTATFGNCVYFCSESNFLSYLYIIGGLWSDLNWRKFLKSLKRELLIL